MRVLVLGGSVFLSRATAAEAVRRGHEVVCASRGVSGPATGRVPDGARAVVWDRSDGAPPPSELVGRPGGRFDAVVDVARHPSWVRTAVDTWPTAHHTFVSSVNVYADDATPGQTPASGPLVAPQPDDVPLDSAPDAYGRMKAACEQIVVEGARAAFVVRPGLIVGPGDPTGRFSYWPERLADVDHPEVLAPGDPTDVVQVVDVRDLAAWVVTALETDLSGTFDGVGAPVPIGHLLRDVAGAVGAAVGTPTWVPSEVLTERGVEPWAGDGAMPLWLPRPAHDGLMSHDVTPSLDAGLVLRPVGRTAVDTLAWLRATPDAVRTGWSRAAEAAALAAWHARGAGR